ncbi:hypothetical protein [Actinomycetospora chibensis]|uniref:Uncharacterized protein n=1 Tax=Actinomycetospora chibensis TaxID=663606 RepID=A0ABV9REG2_9PSEU|nr:hypothetical protein [Actinomycetospora chibensis]MDD7925012.1 hypothetical protein [Actinomycetospora chibensis]
MWELIVGALGGVLQLLGVVIAGRGALQTWRTYRPNEPLLDPHEHKLDYLVVRFLAYAQRNLKPPPRTRPVGRAGEADTAPPVAPGTQYQPIAHSPRSEDFALELDRRVRLTRSDLSDLEARVNDSTFSIRDAVQDARREAKSELDGQREETKRLVTEGVRGILLGLFVTGAGIVTQTAALFFGLS